MRLNHVIIFSVTLLFLYDIEPCNYYFFSHLTFLEPCNKNFSVALLFLYDMEPYNYFFSVTLLFLYEIEPCNYYFFSHLTFTV